MIGVGVIGVGYWGPNIIRNFTDNQKFCIVSCSDLKKERLAIIQKRYPTIKVTTDYLEIVRDPKIDLVAICTPVSSHYQIARAALLEGKNVFIEKPMTSKVSEAEDLINIAENKKCNISVDHTFIFTGAVRKIKELINNGEVGNLYYFDSVRVNLGLFQHDVNVLWDLAPHDISIAYFTMGLNPKSVMAVGVDHLGNGQEDIAYLTIRYPNNLIAHIHVNWLSPVKIRRTLIAGDKKMIVWDDNQPSEKIRIYDKGVDIIKNDSDIYDILIKYRTGDMYCPKIDDKEALSVEIDHIYDCINNGKAGLADGKLGLMIVKILEAAQKSIKNRGEEVLI